jgi:hypothetical protein
MYSILTAMFITIAFYAMERRRFQIIFGLAALVAAPVVLGLAGGADGFIYSLVGASVALFLTLPLSILGFVSREDVIVSIALGGILGAIQYAIAFCIATALLSVQRMFRIDPPPRPIEASSAAGLGGNRLLAFDEQSALVEIETMKMLRMDRMDSAAPEGAESSAAGDPASGSSGRGDVLPWCAKLAIATLAVLMVGISF